MDNVWFYEGNLKSRVLNTGDIVKIVERGDTFLEVSYNSVSGRIHRGVLIDLGEEIAEEKLFVFARGYFDEGEYRKSVRLFGTFITHFAQSNYLPEVLYYTGQSYEAIAKTFHEGDTLENIMFNERTHQWYYDGGAYATVVTKFPESTFAPKAGYRLIYIYRMIRYPWSDSVGFAVEWIEGELKLWKDFVVDYQDSEEYVLALLEIGYLNRVLFEITDVEDYRRDAVEIYKEIMEKYPNSVYSAQSKVHLYEIESGKKIYMY